MRQKGLNHKAKLESPAGKVVALFGEVEAARIAGLSIDAVRKWRRTRTTGGGGGLVPSCYQDLYLRVAEQRGLELGPADLIGEPY